MTTMKRDGATNPQSIVSKADFLKLMRQGTKESYEFYVRGAKFTVRVLSIDEQTMVRRQAHLAMANVPGADETDINVEVQKSTLRLATQIDGINSVPPQIFDAMTADEIGLVYDQWLKIMDDVNPSLQVMTEEQFRALVEAVKKKSYSSRDCTLLQLKAIFNAFQDLIIKLEEQQPPKGSSPGGQ